MHIIRANGYPNFMVSSGSITKGTTENYGHVHIPNEFHKPDILQYVIHFSLSPQVNFTTIIKFETLSRDTEYILNKTGIRNKVQTKAENVAKDGQSSSSFIATYLAELPQGLYQRLCQFYTFDFEIFGYDIPPLHSNQSTSL